ncbi:hypothetical protein QZN01_20830 [Burkholderia cenocepacia]|uniref:hypothetical protein n=1 Tax=Burkholderia cenocepacia TaxID=95486 RepID=UPI00264BDDB8|nr:hypothetical protein [Burkholderia cenocepacia]MDN7825101.1 hypothetical protein [Burkholderia cenocepacia]
MSEQGNGAPTDNGESAGAGAAAAGGEGGQRKWTPPASVTQRFSELSRQRKAAEQRAADERARREAVEAENARLRAQLTGGDAGGAGAQGDAGRQAGTHMTQEELDRVAEDLANRKLSEKETRQAVVRIEQSGRQAYQNFDEAMGQFELIGGFTPGFFAAVSRLENAHEILYSLSTDLDRAAELMALDPVSQGLELARLAPTAQRSGQQLTRAPEPIESLNGRAPGLDKDPDQMDNDEWFAMREKQVADARRRGQ